MMNLNMYEDKGYTNEKHVAQYNLNGRTHYVDDATLKFHHSRVISTRVLFDGLMFAIIESCAADMNNTRRGFRFVVFDIAGGVVVRPDLDSLYRTSGAAYKAMNEAVKQIDVKAVTLEALEREKKSLEYASNRVRDRINAALAA